MKIPVCVEDFDLFEISNWSEINFLPINILKCECIHFGNKNTCLSYSINGVPIPTVNTFRDLGVYVDSDLKFSSHHKSIISKSLRSVGLMFKCILSKDYLLLVTLFKIYVFPIISYCSGTVLAVNTFKSIQYEY